MKGHFCFGGGEVKNHKMGFSPQNLEFERFLDLSLDLKLVEQKPSYDNLKILVDSEIRNEVSQLTQTQNLKMGFFPMSFSTINDSKTSFRFGFGLVKLVLSNAHPPPSVRGC